MSCKKGLYFSSDIESIPQFLAFQESIHAESRRDGPGD